MLQPETEGQKLARFERAIDEQIVREMASREALLFDKGATPKELDAFLHHSSTELADWKAQTLAELARAVCDSAAPTLRLQ